MKRSELSHFWVVVGGVAVPLGVAGTDFTTQYLGLRRFQCFPESYLVLAAEFELIVVFRGDQ